MHRIVDGQRLLRAGGADAGRTPRDHLAVLDGHGDQARGVDLRADALEFAREVLSLLEGVRRGRQGGEEGESERRGEDRHGEILTCVEPTARLDAVSVVQAAQRP